MKILPQALVIKPTNQPRKSQESFGPRFRTQSLDCDEQASLASMLLDCEQLLQLFCPLANPCKNSFAYHGKMSQLSRINLIPHANTICEGN